MSYLFKTDLVAATPVVFRASTPENISHCKMHTLQAVGDVLVEAELGESGTFTEIGTFTDEMQLIEGFGYTAWRVTSAAGGSCVLTSKTDGDSR